MKTRVDTFEEFAVTVVSFGNEMKLGYPQRLTLKAHGDNDGKTDRDQESCEAYG